TGLATYVDNIVVRPLTVLSVHDNGKSVTPNNFDLAQNYPNPFNPETRISYRLSETGFTTLTIHDQLGRTIKTLVAQHQSSGDHAVVWNGKDESGNTVSSGIYFYSLNSGKSVQSKKMVLLK
ncbi:MAG: FlgD immunoglobulin-like domain containing protein, partial [Bacteroidota bacterium]